MPPSGLPLAKGQIARVRLWIDQGAPWPDGLLVAPSNEPERRDFHPGPQEAGAIGQLQKMGVEILPIAAGMHWHEATLRGLDPQAEEDALARLKNVPSLIALDLAGVRCSAATLDDVQGLTNLETLHLEHTRINDAGLAQLAGLRHLKYLNLFDTPVTDAGVASLERLTNLVSLHLWRTKVTDAGAQRLEKALPHCQVMRGWSAVEAE